MIILDVEINRTDGSTFNEAALCLSTRLMLLVASFCDDLKSSIGNALKALDYFSVKYGMSYDTAFQLNDLGISHVQIVMRCTPSHCSSMQCFDTNKQAMQSV